MKSLIDIIFVFSQWLLYFNICLMRNVLMLYNDEPMWISAHEVVNHEEFPNRQKHDSILKRYATQFLSKSLLINNVLSVSFERISPCQFCRRTSKVETSKCALIPQFFKAFRNRRSQGCFYHFSLDIQPLILYSIPVQTC